MQAGDRKLGQVFANDHVNVIPLFQRPYVWNADKNWAPLWHDVTRVALEVEAERRSGRPVPSDSTYFLGAVVVHERVGTNPERVGSSHIIDGQQRLTTLQVLLAAMRRVAADRGQDKVAAQCTALLENRDEVLDKDFPEDRYKVWPLPQDRDAFLWAVRRPGDDERDPPPGQRLVDARAWFEERLVEWLDEEGAEPTRLGDLWLALNSRMQIVQINLGPSDQPQIIFEALNHRGVQLAEADLVKNHLFYAVEMQGDGPSAERLLLDHWLALDQAEWRTVVTTGRIKRARVDLLLAYWLTIRTRNDVVVDTLFSDFKVWFATAEERAADVIRDLRRHADVYASLSGLPVNTPTGRLVATMRASGTNTPWPVLFALYANPAVPPVQRDVAAAAIDSFLMRRGVGGLTSKDYNHLFLAVLKDVLDAEPEHAGDAVVLSLGRQTADSRSWPDDAEFAAALAADGLYSRMYRGRLKALLVCIENALRTDAVVGNSLLDPADETLNIEHVMPQSWRENWPLPAGADDDAEVAREAAIHRLGNLTLATTKLNPTLSNKPWSEKQPILQARSLVCITTASILSSPDDDMFTTAAWTDVWDETRIDVRTRVLADLALLLWPGPPTRVAPALGGDGDNG